MFSMGSENSYNILHCITCKGGLECECVLCCGLWQTSLICRANNQQIGLLQHVGEFTVASVTRREAGNCFPIAWCIYPQWVLNYPEHAVTWSFDESEWAISWPLHSLDLIPFYFFLWGYIKNEVYVLPLPATLGNLKDCIWNVNIDINLLQNIWSKQNVTLLCVKHTLNSTQLHRYIKKTFWVSFSNGICFILSCLSVLFKYISWKVLSKLVISLYFSSLIRWGDLLIMYKLYF
jgi:hypothetical protein